MPGEPLRVNLSVSRIHTSPGPLGLVVARDISARKRAEEVLRQAHDELEIRVGEGTAELSEANERLHQEIDERKAAQEQLNKSRDLLEQRVRERTSDLITANRQLRQEIDERKRTEYILQSIAEGTSSDLGDDFFPSLVRNLATSLNVRYAFVAECLDWPTTRVRTLAAWMGDRLGENLEYEVAGTPCAETVSGMRTFYARELQRLFPKDRVLVELGAESYCGLPVCDASGQVIGHVAVLDDKPMDDDFSDLPALRILAARAAAELHRKRAEEQSQQLSTEIAHVFRLSTMGELASCLAHEINQPLGIIANNARAC
ncbi:MAG: hypothetical protein IH999_08570, partial [Proteobacteria bacterium]|nr:hypothetical protein [Pseudomonadota bacterium]